MRQVLLVTGFGPFPRVRVNPTEQLAHKVAGSRRLRRLGIEAAAHVFATRYGTVAAELPALHAGATAFLHLGLAARTRWVRVECRGRGASSPTAPDAGGRSSAGAAPPKAGPQATTAPAAEVLAALRRAGIPARLSNDAGRYLCDRLYHASLSLARTRRPAPPAVFVHIPWLAGGKPRPVGKRPRIRPERLAVALEEAAVRLVLAARRREPFSHREKVPGEAGRMRAGTEASVIGFSCPTLSFQGDAKRRARNP